MTSTTTPTLTEAGQKLADALMKAGVISTYDGMPYIRSEITRAVTAPLNTAAALLFTAHEREGAGLREAQAHLPLAVSEPHDRHQPSGSILVTDAANNDIAVFLHRDQATVGQSYEVALAFANQFVSAANSALASPQPAVEGAVAAGVGPLLGGILEIVCRQIHDSLGDEDADALMHPDLRHGLRRPNMKRWEQWLTTAAPLLMELHGLGRVVLLPAELAEIKRHADGDFGPEIAQADPSEPATAGMVPQPVQQQQGKAPDAPRLIAAEMEPAQMERMVCSLSAQFAPDFVEDHKAFALAVYAEAYAIGRPATLTLPTDPKPEPVTQGASEATRILTNANRSGDLPGCMMPDGAEPCSAFSGLDQAVRDALTALSGTAGGIEVERIGKDRQGVSVIFARSEYDSEAHRVEEPMNGLVVVLDVDGTILSLDIPDLKADMTAPVEGPADPKPTVPGNDAGMREAASAADHARAWVAAEYRVTGSPHEHTASDSLAMARYILSGQAPADRELRPCPEENENLCCFPSCNCARHRLAPQTGSAGEDPKTPDAGVAADLRAAQTLAHVGHALECGRPDLARKALNEFFGASQPATGGSVGDGGLRAAKLEYCVMNVAAGLRCALERPDTELRDHLQSALDSFNELARTVDDPPAPVGEDETGVREVDEIVSSLYRRFKEWAKRGFGPDDVTWCEVKADVLALIRAPQPPKAETPAGVGDVRITSANGKHWRLEGPGWTMQPIGQVTASEARGICERTLAALSTAPAARPGDEVERVSEVLRVRLERWGYSTGSCSRAQLAHDILAALAAAPAADGGRA